MMLLNSMGHFSSFLNLINMVLHHQNLIQSLLIIHYGLLISRTVKTIVKENGIVSAHGKAGTVVIFVDNLVHGSAQNMSPMDRAIFSVILNPCDNAQTKFARPEYKHGRNFKPIKPSSNKSLLN